MRLWKQVIIGLCLGILTGWLLRENIDDIAERTAWAENIKILGVIFIDLIKMVMVPLIFFALISGITSIGEGKDLKRVGFKSLIAYLTTVVFAVCIGLAAGNFFEPGKNAPQIKGATTVTVIKADTPSLKDTFLRVIPDNAIGAMAQANILQVIVFAIFVAVIITLLGDKVKLVDQLCHEAALIMFKIIGVIVKLAPYGVYGYITYTVTMQGIESLESLVVLVYAVLAACLVQYLVFGVLILVFGRISPIPFYKKIFDVQTIAFSTTSSKATLPIAMEQLGTKMGVSKNSRNFVLPLGAAVNMDGTAIYLGICALFFAQSYGLELGMHEYLMIIATSTLGSIGAAGIPSGSLIFMGMVLSSIGLPIEGIALIAGVDRILDMFRTTINITGDAAITLIIDSSEKKLDEKVYYAKSKH